VASYTAANPESGRIVPVPAEISYCVPDGHPSLPGHFPEAPLVPGVLLLGHIVADVQRQLPGRRVTGIRKLKFLHLLLPGQRFTVTVESPRDDAVRFLCRRGEVLLAEGRLYLAPLADSANGSPY